MGTPAGPTPIGDDAGDDVGPALTAEERSAIRAYLQRSEVRLSTVHRVASALLSGAGLLVLLPAVARDSVVDVLRALLSGSVSLVDALIVVAMAASLVLPFTALLFLLRDLTQFYFHANHVKHADGETFTPRFTLTALRLPRDELGAGADAELDVVRRADRSIELLVPSNDAARSRVDRRVSAYGLDDLDGRDDEDERGGLGGRDRGRAAALFELAASRPRDLLDEVAKVEHGMARHVLRIQTIVLRYVKALLALLTPAMAAFAAAAVVGGAGELTIGDETWVAAILLVWAPVVIAAVTAPVRWLEGQLRSEGATHTAVSEDPELTRVEVVTVRLALVGFAAAVAAMGVCLSRPDLTTGGRAAAAAALVATVAAVVAVLWSWAGPATIRRLLSSG